MKLKKNIRLLITADGGAASGKTTGAKLISKKYGLNFLSSGLLYRYVSYKLLAKKNNKNNISYLKSITKNITPNNRSEYFERSSDRISPSFRCKAQSPSLNRCEDQTYPLGRQALGLRK